MNPTSVEYGECYSDDSGWGKRLKIDVHTARVEIETGGDQCCMKLDELWWIVQAALLAREALGMDKLVPEEPQHPSATGNS